MPVADTSTTSSAPTGSGLISRLPPHAFGFFEEVLKLSEGQFEGQPFRLEPSQAFIIGSLFGWKRADGRRRFRRGFCQRDGRF